MNFDKGELLNFYEEIENKRNERDEHIEQVEKLAHDIQFGLLEYRMRSVHRCLRYLVGIDKNMDKTLNHCIDKLDGKLDGEELDLKEELDYEQQ